VLFLKAFGVWLAMLLAAFLNGALRELLLIPLVGEYVGHVLSVILLSGAIFGLTYLFVKTLRPLSTHTLLRIGGFWLVLSLSFEFGFFHYVMRESWEKLLADYNLFQGRLLIAVWLTTLFAPLICGKIVQHS
jgi:hypothetical protein